MMMVMILTFLWQSALRGTCVLRCCEWKSRTVWTNWRLRVQADLRGKYVTIMICNDYCFVHTDVHFSCKYKLFYWYKYSLIVVGIEDVRSFIVGGYQRLDNKAGDLSSQVSQKPAHVATWPIATWRILFIYFFIFLVFCIFTFCILFFRQCIFRLFLFSCYILCRRVRLTFS